jgi:type VI secretion system protein VasJ
LWLGLKQSPKPRSDTGLCPIRNGATTARKNAIAQAQAGRDHPEVVRSVESMLSRSTMFWLDAHRIVASALEALGHTAARDAVIDAFGNFLRSHPGIEHLRFEDGEHFADARTLLWIRERIQTSSATSVGSLSPATATASESTGGAGDGRAEWVQAAKEARALLLEAKKIDALMRLETGRRQAGCERERFQWTLELARVCLDAGLPELAQPHLEHLESQVEVFRLEQWEPEMSVAVARSLLAAYAGSKEKELGERRKVLQARIARLDVVTAAKEAG